MIEIWNKIQAYTFEYQDNQENAPDIIALDIARSRPSRITAVEREILKLPSPISNETACQKFKSQHTTDVIRSAIENLVHNRWLLPPNQPLPQSPKEPRFVRITALELNMAEDCNLRCAYCCVGQGGFGAVHSSLALNQPDSGRHRGLMSWEVARQAIDLLFRSASPDIDQNSGSKPGGDNQKLHIRFFGGEPLMNQAVIVKSVLYAEALAVQNHTDIRFSIVTNGTLLTSEFINFMKDHHFWVQISLDGTREMHDAFRVDVDQKGSYNRAVAQVPYLIEKISLNNLQARSTLTHFEVDPVKAFEALRELGFKNPDIRPVTGKGGVYSMTVEDYRHFNHGLDKLARRLLASRGEETANYVAIFEPYLELLTNRIARRPPCGAGRNMIGVGIDGSIRPCTDMIGKDDEIIDFGNLHDLIPVDMIQARKERFLGIVDVDNKPVCRRCWARYICGGACASVELSHEGGLEMNAGLECIWIRHAIKVALWLYVRMLEERPDIFYELFGRSVGLDLSSLSEIFLIGGNQP